MRSSLVSTHLILWSVLAATLPLAAQTAGTGSKPATDLTPRIDAIFAEHARADAPGCAVGVARDGETVFMKGYGRASLERDFPITPETAFNIGSVGKQFTAMAVLLLEQQKKLALDDDIRRFVPELRDYGTPIRVRDLVQHTSGLRDYGTLGRLAAWPARTMEEFLDLMSRQRGLNFVPGSRHTYSHSDYTLLALVVERAAGEPFGEFLEREIWRPLSMTATRLHDGRGLPVVGRAFAYAPGKPDEHGYRVRFPSSEVSGGNNVYTSVEDLLRWQRNFRTAAVGGRGLVDRMLSRPTLASGATIPYAYGLMRGEYRGLRTLYRGGSGGGFSTELTHFPDQGLTVVTLCNVRPAHPGRLNEAVAELYLGEAFAREPVIREQPSVAAPPEELERYAGSYRPIQDPWNLLYLVVEDGALCERIGQQTYRLLRLADGRYREGETFYAFTPPVDGRPLRLTLTPPEGPDEIEVLDRLPTGGPWNPSARELADYAGSYYSEDLGIVWELAIMDDALVLRRPRAQASRPTPVERDIFRAELESSEEALAAGMSFERRADGRVTRLSVTALPHPYEVVRDLRFEKITRE